MSLRYLYRTFIFTSGTQPTIIGSRVCAIDPSLTTTATTPTATTTTSPPTTTMNPEEWCKEQPQNLLTLHLGNRGKIQRHGPDSYIVRVKVSKSQSEVQCTFNHYFFSNRWRRILFTVQLSHLLGLHVVQILLKNLPMEI